MPRRATARGSARGPLDAPEADVLICGASFAGLAVARELARAGLDGRRVLLLDRYEVGERATSACAVPTPWLGAVDARAAGRQEIPCMRFHTPHGSARYRLPWSWTAFDYRVLCHELLAQAGATRFATATVQGIDRARSGEAHLVRTDRGEVRARIVVDALGWRRVLGERLHQPPESPLSRGLEVHPHGSGEDLDVFIDRSLVRFGYGWSVPAGGEQRVGVGSYEPRHHVRAGTEELVGRLAREPVHWQGNWFPHRLRPAVERGVAFVGDSAGHCFPLSGEGIRTALYFGIACARALRPTLLGQLDAERALARYAAFSARHAPAFRLAGRLQRLIPALPPRVLAALLRAMSSQPLVDRVFAWYLDQAHPDFAGPETAAGARRRPAAALSS